MAAQLSSTGVSHHSLLPHLPLVHLSIVNISPCLGIAPQTLSSGSQLLHLLEYLRPCPEYIWHGRDCLILIPLRLPQTSWFPLSLNCLSSDSDNCPNVGIGPLLQFLHPPMAGSVLVTLQFFPLVPSSYQVLCGSIYSFLPVRNSCLLSAGALHALPCLKVYS